MVETLREFIVHPNSESIRTVIHDQLDWFQDTPVSPRPAEDATEDLKRAIQKNLDAWECGLLSERETVLQIADAFHGRRYPPLLEVLDVVALLPKQLLATIREHLGD